MEKFLVPIAPPPNTSTSQEERQTTSSVPVEKHRNSRPSHYDEYIMRDSNIESYLNKL